MSDVLLQGCVLPERHAFAEGSRVVPALLVHRLGSRLQVTLAPEGDARHPMPTAPGRMF